MTYRCELATGIDAVDLFATDAIWMVNGRSTHIPVSDAQSLSQWCFGPVGH